MPVRMTQRALKRMHRQALRRGSVFKPVGLTQAVNTAGPLGCYVDSDCGGYGVCRNGECVYPLATARRSHNPNGFVARPQGPVPDLSCPEGYVLECDQVSDDEVTCSCIKFGDEGEIVDTALPTQSVTRTPGFASQVPSSSPVRGRGPTTLRQLRRARRTAIRNGSAPPGSSFASPPGLPQGAAAQRPTYAVSEYWGY